MILRRFILIDSKYYGMKKDEKLETVDKNSPFLIMLQQNIDICYILYAEKILVDPIDLAYPKPPLLGVLWFFLTFEKPHFTC